jgi:hypothetical protein
MQFESEGGTGMDNPIHEFDRDGAVAKTAGRAFDRTVPEGATVAVTVERAGGVSRPTGAADTSATNSA